MQEQEGDSNGECNNAMRMRQVRQHGANDQLPAGQIQMVFLVPKHSRVLAKYQTTSCKIIIVPKVASSAPAD